MSRKVHKSIRSGTPAAIAKYSRVLDKDLFSECEAALEGILIACQVNAPRKRKASSSTDEADQTNTGDVVAREKSLREGQSALMQAQERIKQKFAALEKQAASLKSFRGNGGKWKGGGKGKEKAQQPKGNGNDLAKKKDRRGNKKKSIS